MIEIVEVITDRDRNNRRLSQTMIEIIEVILDLDRNSRDYHKP